MTQSRLALWMKWLFFPGLNIASRSRKSIVRFFLAERDCRTLDVGCGNGYFTSRAARRGGTAVGFSFDPSQIERCNQFKPYMGIPADRVTFATADVHTLDQMEEQFDQVLLLEVIEHVDDDALLLRQIARRLKPCGVLHLTTPQSSTGHLVGFLDRHANGGHCRLGYTPQRIESLLMAAGLDVSYSRAVGGLGTYLTPFQNRLNRWLGGNLIAQVTSFGLIYPFYFLLELVPVSSQRKTVLYIIARRPVHSPTTTDTVRVV